MSNNPSFHIDFGQLDQQKEEVDVTKVVFYLIICVVGLLGNLFAIFVILVLREYKKSVTHWYVLQLAIADSLFLLTLPFKVTEDFNNGWIYSDWLCKAKETILFLNYYASIIFLVVMSIDRYIAVCHTLSFAHRLRNQNNAFIVTFSVWAVSLLLCIPIMLYSSKSGTHPNCKCVYEFPNPKNLTEICLEEGYESDKEIATCISDLKKKDYESGESHCAPLNFPISSLNGSLDHLQNNVSLDSNIFKSFDSTGFYSLSEFDSEDVGYSTETDEVSESSGKLDNSYFKNLDHGLREACHYYDRSFGWKFFLLFNFLVMFCLPFFIMLACYGLIIHRLSTTKIRSASTASYKQSVRNGANQKKKSTSRSDKERKRVTIMCAALVACFLILWLPFHAIHLAKLDGINFKTDHACEVLGVIGTILAYINSALNPYLYSFLGTNFSKRWQLVKKNPGIQQFVSFRKQAPKDSTAFSKDSDKTGSRNQASKFTRFQPNADNKISNQRLTMITKLQKENDSSQVQPTMQTDFSRPQSMEILSKGESSGTEEK